MKPTTSYLICATPRSGSYLLCEALTNTGIAGRPAEYFWRGHESFWAERWGATTSEEYLQGALREATTGNGVFGAKTVWSYMDYFLETLGGLSGGPQLDDHLLLTSAFPNLLYVWMRRQDKVRQAISYWRAIHTGLWMCKENRPPPALDDALFDFPAIDRLRHEIIQDEISWARFFCRAGVEPLEVIYEDLVEDYQGTALRTLQFLGIPVPPDLAFAPRHLRRQADEISERWVTRFYDRIRLQSA